jgi:chemotaxis protein MotA
VDIATLLGIFLGIGSILWGMMGGGSLSTFVEFRSMAITFGGAIAGTLIAFPFSRVVQTFKIAGKIFQKQEQDPESVIATLVAFAERARRDGLLALEDEAQHLPDPFLQKGIQLVVDGTDPELVRSILEIELSFLEERHKQGQRLFETIGFLAPAFGMIGTLIGLIQMLKQLQDPSTVGPNMAIALITTLYGALLANLVCIPTANKLGVRSSEEILLKEVIIEGILSIQAGENPRIVREKLEAFLSPVRRNNIGDVSLSQEERVVVGSGR